MKEQRLIPRSLTSRPKQGRPTATSIDEGVRASVMDPLWFLARQWQMGEFKAENCGSIASVSLKSSLTSIDRVFHSIKPRGGEEGEPVDDNLPIEPIVESKKTNLSKLDLDNSDALEAPKSWMDRNLEYQFSIGTFDKTTLLQAKEYYGEKLDWHSFQIESVEFPDDVAKKLVSPQPVRFPGMPKVRWWQFEDEKTDLGNIQRPNLNYLSVLLTEFALLYSNDWFIIPVQQPVGSLRKVEALSVMDVFGNPPINAQAHVYRQNEDPESRGFTLFSLTRKKDDKSEADSSILLLPNTLTQFIQGEALEEVIFSRDEMANFVWAIERRSFEKGKIQNREDEEMDSKWNSEIGNDGTRPEADLKTDPGNLPQYKIMSPLRGNWIPYISVQNLKDKNDKNKEQIYFRRGKTKLDTNPQYKTKIITNSTRIWEEEIPTIPIVLTQNAKMIVYDSEKWSLDKQDRDGRIVFSLNKESGAQIRLIWIGRKKNRSVRQRSSGLNFDCLIEDH
jgi:hypothetical protein